MQKEQNRMWRYMAIAVIFCLACVIYLGRLFYIQISGRDSQYGGGTATRRVTVQAVRGEIYDCEGRPLVTNRYTYDLTLSYNSFSALGNRISNGVCLSLIELTDDMNEGKLREEKFFPFDGEYPHYRFSAEAADGESVRFYRLRRVLGDVGLDEDANEDKITDYYVETYGLLATDSSGKRLYNDYEVDRLIRIRYDMDAVRFRSAGEYVIAEEVGLSLMTAVKELNLGGTTFRVDAERVYHYPGYASHILGTVGPIYSEEWEYYNEQGYQMSAIVGKTGCEYAFEQYLRGTDGELEIEEDAAGNVVSVKEIRAPIAGSDVRLTIDIDLQIAAEDGLAENVASVLESSPNSGCGAGAAVVMDPESFAVLAIASYPTYDLSTYNLDYNDLASNAAQPLLNRALNGVYAPGSTYKLGVAAAALMEGVVTPSTYINCSGKYPYWHKPTCSTYPQTHSGDIEVVEAIAVSCNCYFYEIGYRMGIDSLNRYMQAFGFGEDTGLELGGASGALAGPLYRLEHNLTAWMPGDVLSASIGQSDNTATPLQLACYLSTLVGGGTRYGAHLLSGVYAFGSEMPTVTYTQNLLSQMDIPDATLSTVFEGMRQVVRSNNTVSRNMRNVPVTVGGKTGTAENGTDYPNALFVCAAPYDNPDVVISVVLERGVSGGNASLTAARILEQYYKSE